MSGRLVKLYKLAAEHDLPDEYIVLLETLGDEVWDRERLLQFLVDCNGGKEYRARQLLSDILGTTYNSALKMLRLNPDGSRIREPGSRSVRILQLIYLVKEITKDNPELFENYIKMVRILNRMEGE